MKLINKFAAVALVAMGMSACVDKDIDFATFPDPDVDFTYNVAGDEYPLDFYVVSTIQFNNKSSKTGNMTWDFGDGTTSNDPNPTHKYEAAGNYKVSLTIDGAGTRVYPLMIYDIVPSLSVDQQSTEIIEYNNTTLTFALELPNPENLRVRYEWTFPEGTVDEAGNKVETFVGYSDENGNIEYPAPVKFTNIGSQRVDIATYFDVDGENRRLENTYLNVQVGYDKPVPTLYYAQRSGNIKAMKIIDDLPKGVKVLPYDLGVPTGSTVFNLVYADLPATNEDGESTTEGYIYILDAGKQYYYINDEDGVLGDGLITAMRTDGTGVNTVITNVGGAAFNDPFRGVAYNGNLYYSDRNTGFSSIALTARGEVQGKNSANNRDSYVMTNQRTPYYGRGLAYGAITCALARDSKGCWWCGKNYNGVGIFRFKDTDIYATQADAEKVAIPYPIVLPDMKISTFAIDEKNNRLFCWRTTPNPGFLEYPLPTGELKPADFVKYVAMDADPVNTTADEGLFTTQLAVDNNTGKVYFCFRPTATDESKVPAGIVVYDPATGKCAPYGNTNDLGTGIVINPNPTKLF